MIPFKFRFLRRPRYLDAGYPYLSGTFLADTLLQADFTELAKHKRSGRRQPERVTGIRPRLQAACCRLPRLAWGRPVAPAVVTVTRLRVRAYPG